MIRLHYNTPPQWAQEALRDLDAFLLDHASCERKASAVGLSFVVRYPDRKRILEPLIEFAREELLHFHQVYRIIEARGLTLLPDEEDDYVRALLKQVRCGREERLLDRLLVSGIIEARGTERMALVAEAVENPVLKQFYRNLAAAESRHKDLFVELALEYFSEAQVNERLEELLAFEASIVKTLPTRSALH